MFPANLFNHRSVPLRLTIMPLEYDRLSNPDSPNKYHKHKVILYTLLSILPFCSIPEPQHLKNDFCHCQWVL